MTGEDEGIRIGNGGFFFFFIMLASLSRKRKGGRSKNMMGNGLLFLAEIQGRVGRIDS